MSTYQYKHTTHNWSVVGSLADFIHLLFSKKIVSVALWEFESLNLAPYRRMGVSKSPEAHATDFAPSLLRKGGPVGTPSYAHLATPQIVYGRSAKSSRWGILAEPLISLGIPYRRIGRSIIPLTRNDLAIEDERFPTQYLCSFERISQVTPVPPMPLSGLARAYPPISVSYTRDITKST